MNNSLVVFENAVVHDVFTNWVSSQGTANRHLSELVEAIAWKRRYLVCQRMSFHSEGKYMESCILVVENKE
jgi:hypothetical protein